eukprot:SAG11_NODE_275_length_11309_cov_6.090901_8_plen_232_part_00
MTALLAQMAILQFDYAKAAGERTEAEAESAGAVFRDICETMLVPRNMTMVPLEYARRYDDYAANSTSVATVACMSIDGIETHWCMPPSCIETTFMPSMSDAYPNRREGDMQRVPRMLGCNPSMQIISDLAATLVPLNAATRVLAVAGTSPPPFLATCAVEGCDTTARAVVVWVIMMMMLAMCIMTVKSIWKARTCRDCNPTKPAGEAFVPKDVHDEQVFNHPTGEAKIEGP